MNTHPLEWKTISARDMARVEATRIRITLPRSGYIVHELVATFRTYDGPEDRPETGPLKAEETVYSADNSASVHQAQQMFLRACEHLRGSAPSPLRPSVRQPLRSA